MVGQWVTARVLGWRESQLNNLLAEPDPSLPSLEGVPEWVEGILYNPLPGRYMVAKFDVEPASITPIPPAEGGSESRT